MTPAFMRNSDAGLIGTNDLGVHPIDGKKWALTCAFDVVPTGLEPVTSSL